jgi:hypothetical protein
MYRRKVVRGERSTTAVEEEEEEDLQYLTKEEEEEDELRVGWRCWWCAGAGLFELE